jgi:hypothetical protein
MAEMSQYIGDTIMEQLGLTEQQYKVKLDRLLAKMPQAVLQERLKQGKPLDRSWGYYMLAVGAGLTEPPFTALQRALAEGKEKKGDA